MLRREFLAFIATLGTGGTARVERAAGEAQLPKELIWPAAAIIVAEGDDGQAKSHFGGSPRLPLDFDWPERHGRPLDFILDVDLAEMGAARTNLDLPAAGRLLFFYDAKEQPWGFKPSDAGGARVVYVPEEIPTFVPAPGTPATFPEARVFFTPVATLPDPWSTWVKDLEPDVDRRSAMDEIFEGVSYLGSQIGGHAAPIQVAEMDLECELVTAGYDLGSTRPPESREIAMRRRAQKWRLLAQIRSGEAPGMEWGDSGYLYYWIPVDDLARRDFSRVWLILQCS